MGNHKDPAVIEQMQIKHPARKEEIVELMAAEMAAHWKGINREVFNVALKKLKHDVTLDLGCLHNKHLLELLFNKERQMIPSAQSAATSY